MLKPLRLGITLFRPTWVMLVLAFIFSFAFIEINYQTKTFERLENYYNDFWHQQMGKRFSPEHVSLVLIDEYSLNKLSDTPLTFWTPYIAKIVGALRDNGASVIGVDLLFSASAEQWLRQFDRLPESAQNYDRAIREEINKGKVVLVASSQQLKNGHDGFVLPIPSMVLSLPELDHTEKYLGLSDLTADSDSAYRRYLGVKPLNLPPEVQEAPPAKYTFGALLALTTKHFNAVDTLAIEKKNTPEPIVFAGPPGTVPRMSFYRLLEAVVNAETQSVEQDKPIALPSTFLNHIKDKVVIIGSDYVGLNDIHTTPYGVQFFGQAAQPMSGPEIQANIVETILGNHTMQPLSADFRWFLTSLILLIGVTAFRYTNYAVGTSILLLLHFLSMGVGYWIFTTYQTFPTASVQIGMMLIFVGVYALRFMGETRKRKHIQSMFGKYVPKDVVSELLENDETPPLGGVSYDITVLFSDIRNFTTISEVLEPNEVVELINNYFSRVVPCIEQNAGMVDKFIGDAIMAEFGAPIRRKNHAIAAIQSALLVKREAEAFQTWFINRFPPKTYPQLEEIGFDIGIGVNSGPAIMGNIGSAEKREYTALGDTVNIASRLEGITKSTGWAIIASDSTIKAAGGRVITRGKDRITVKGRREPILIHEVIGLKEDFDKLDI